MLMAVEQLLLPLYNDKVLPLQRHTLVPSLHRLPGRP